MFPKGREVIKKKNIKSLLLSNPNLKLSAYRDKHRNLLDEKHSLAIERVEGERDLVMSKKRKIIEEITSLKVDKVYMKQLVKNTYKKTK